MLVSVGKGSLVLPFLVFIALSLFLQYSTPYLVGYDGYFHIKFSYLLRDYGFIDRLPWLQFTIYKEHFRNHHLLFHYLIIPFTYLDLMTGAKIAASFFMAVAWYVFYLILRASKIPYAALWSVVGFVSSETFLYRLSMLRIQSLSLALLLFIFLLHAQRRYKLIFLFTVVFVYLYDAFPLVLFISVCFLVSDFLISRILNYRYLMASGGGSLLGMVVNPYFPENIESFVFNMYRTLFLKEKFVRVGTEWYPYSSWGLLENMLVASLCFALLVVFLPFVKDIKREELALLLLSLGFLFLIFKSRRFVEYSPAFVMLTFLLVAVKRLNLKHSLALLVLLTPLSAFTFYEAYKSVGRAKNPIAYKGAALWLKNNSQAGDIVFNSDWDDFPFLFFYNHKNYYIVGLDPMYMYRYDPKLYRRYQRITRGKVKNPSAEIARRFRAKFVFTDKKHKRLIKRLNEDKNAWKVYEDRWSLVYKISF